MTTARPPLSRTICPCLSLLSTDCCLTPRCHTLRRCSLTVRTLCLRREEWNHDPPAFTTRNSYWRRRQDYSSLSVRHAALSILSKGAYEHPSVKRIATESLYIDETCCYPLSLIPLLLKFWWSSSSITTKTGVMWLSPCCHTFRRCSLTVRTLCIRREEWDHDPPEVTTRNS